jgi:hypothetical protein
MVTAGKLFMNAALKKLVKIEDGEKSDPVKC